MKYSLVIPVYNRPDEVSELLESLTHQAFTDFEVIIVEDGSSVPCLDVVKAYEGRLDVHYFSKPNSGPGQTRNYGAERSEGEYLLIVANFEPQRETVEIIVPAHAFEHCHLPSGCHPRAQDGCG